MPSDEPLTKMSRVAVMIISAPIWIPAAIVVVVLLSLVAVPELIFASIVWAFTGEWECEL